jgi:hypothetical protein
VLIRILNVLDIGTAVRAIFRRFYLIRLLDHRIQRENYYKNRKLIRVKTQHKQNYQNLELLNQNPDDQLAESELN